MDRQQKGMRGLWKRLNWKLQPEQVGKLVSQSAVIMFGRAR
jgi:hypothetical protein